MSEIKSAREIALEKAARIGNATEEERLKWKYTPEGEHLAASYLKEDHNLVAELSQYPERVRKYVAQGGSEVLIRNISLPKNDSIKKNNKRAMDGLKMLKNEKAKVENVFSKIRFLFEHYAKEGEQQRKQAYQALKADLEGKVQQALQQQLGSLAKTKIDIENQPEFQVEWRKVLTELDSSYITYLNEYKRELLNIS